jgi:hypothetical protein
MRIASHLPRRSARDCEARWNELRALPAADVDGNDNKVRCLVAVTPPPELFANVPLLPLMKIFGYLEYKQVFGIVPRVCQYFHELLVKHKVGLDTLVLRKPSDLLLEKLIDEVSTCERLDLELQRAMNDATKSILTRLLKQFKRSVVEFECSVDNSDQAVIASFVNECERLRCLTLHMRFPSPRWDWSLHSVYCGTVEELRLDDRYESRNMTGIFFMFPALKRLIQSNSLPPYEDIDEDGVVNLNNVNHHQQATIEYLETSVLPPVQFLQYVNHIVLSCITGLTLQQLVGSLPQLKSLKKLDLKFDLLLELFDECSVGHDLMKRLMAALSTSSVTELDITNDPDNNIGRHYDLSAFNLLCALPKSVQCIRYKKCTIRRF